MCAICGIIYKDSDHLVEKEILIRMRDIMFHRGPDDAGAYFNQNVGLGHRRLSIIDLESGHQPMANEDDTIWIVFNGEIYNFKELKRDLVKQGHRFKTNSDTEVIIHLYEQYGIDCVTKMNGMFTFAIWDQNRRRLFLARDRLGIKPLYYMKSKDGLFFASEIKSILQHPMVSRIVNTKVIKEYLVFRFVAGEETFFENIFNLLPGHLMVYKDGAINIRSYWEPSIKDEWSSQGRDFYLKRIDELMKEAVTMRLMSDVPLGTFCSGGVDSSLVTAYAANMTHKPLHTFCVGYEETKLDERKYSRMVSKKYRTDHHEIEVHNIDFSKELPRMIWNLDEPLNHANSIQMYLISKLSKEFVTVILTGEGADELFGGYPRYFIPKFYFKYLNHHQGKPLSRLAVRTISSMPGRRLKKLKESFSQRPEQVIMHNAGFANLDLLDQVYAGDTPEDFCEYRSHCIEQISAYSSHPMTSLAIFELKTYLVSILNRTDKMSMAASIECRVPILDHRIVEFAINIPWNLKLHRFTTKDILKKLAKEYLPHTIVCRPKVGFATPMSDWLRDNKGMGKYLEMLFDPEFRQRGYYHYNYLKQLIRQHLNGTRDYSNILWPIINMELWERIFIEQDSVTF